MDKNVFPAGSYVVLLSSCAGNDNWKHSLPEQHIYQLREDSATYKFRVERNIVGTPDGWSTTALDSRLNKLSLRAATEEEIKAYDKGIRKVADIVPLNNLIYQIY